MLTLRFRKLERRDLPQRVAWFNDPAVFRQMTVPVPFSLAETEAWFARTLLNDRRRDFAVELVEQEGEKALAALGGLVEIDRRHGRAELYVLARPERTGEGIGGAAVRWLCDYGFLALDLHRIYLTTLAHNEAARRLYERLGFTHEGVQRQHIYHDGAFVDQHVQALLRDEWSRTPWRATRLAFTAALDPERK